MNIVGDNHFHKEARLDTSMDNQNTVSPLAHLLRGTNFQKQQCPILLATDTSLCDHDASLSAQSQPTAQAGPWKRVNATRMPHRIWRRSRGTDYIWKVKRERCT